MKEVRIKVEFLELSQKTFTKMKHFKKHLSMENSILLTLRAPKSHVFQGRFLQIYMGDHRTLIGACMYLISSGRLVEGAQ